MSRLKQKKEEKLTSFRRPDTLRQVDAIVLAPIADANYL